MFQFAQGRNGQKALDFVSSFLVRESAKAGSPWHGYPSPHAHWLVTNPGLTVFQLCVGSKQFNQPAQRSGGQLVIVAQAIATDRSTKAHR